MDELIIINMNDQFLVSPTFFQSMLETEVINEPRRVIVKHEDITTNINPTNYPRDMIKYKTGKVLNISIFKSTGELLLGGIFTIPIIVNIYESKIEITKRQSFNPVSFEVNYKEGGLEVIDLLKESELQDDLLSRVEKMVIVPRPRESQNITKEIQSSEEIDILNIVSNSGPVKPIDIAKALKLDKTTVNKSLHNLFKNRKVSVYRHADKTNPRYILGPGEEIIDEKDLDVSDIQIRNILRNKGQMTAPELSKEILGMANREAIKAVNSVLHRMPDVVKGKSEYDIYPVWNIR